MGDRDEHGIHLGEREKAMAVVEESLEEAERTGEGHYLAELRCMHMDLVF